MATIKGLGLSLIQKLYSLPSAQILGVTDLDTDSVSQTLPIIPNILRRSDNIIGNNQGGWLQGVMENVHSGADDEVSTYRPYDGTAAGSTTLVGAAAGFPAPIPSGWDLWILGCSLERTSGAGTVVGLLALNGNPLGWGIDDAGAAVTDTPLFNLARFTSIVADAAALAYGIGADGQPWQPVNLRLPGQIALEFHTTSSAAVTVQLAILMGLFPEAMGQDVVT